MRKDQRNKILVLLVFAFLIFNFAFPEIPRLIQYQGKATDKSSGLPLSGNHNITFRMYDTPTTTTILWEEQHLGVPLTNGNFSLQMGSQNTLDLPFDKSYWLGVEIDNDGEMLPRERLVSVPYAYTAEKAIQAEIALSASIPFYLEGLELEYVDSQHIRIAPGVAEIGGKIVFSEDYSSPLDINNDSNYLSGHNNPNPWIYVYVYNSIDRMGYTFGDEAPNKSDSRGNANGIKRFYIYTNIIYRCVGAVRTDTGTKAGNLLKFFQRDNMIIWDVPINVTTTSSTGSWSSAVDCSSAIPAISTMGVFGIFLSSNEHHTFTAWIRPNGSNWSTGEENGVHQRASVTGIPDSATSGQRHCATDESRKIQHMEIGGSSHTVAIDVETYILNIR